MALIRRLDHMILCGRDRHEWVPLIEKVLGLRPGRSREGDQWGFSNAEFNIGDGFLGLVEPAGDTSQLHRFLARYPEGYYAVSVDVGDLAAAAAFLEARDVPFRRAMRGEEVGLLWVPPSATEGVLYQLTPRVPPEPGHNPEYLGFSGVMLAVDGLDSAVAAYGRCFDLVETRPVEFGRLGCRGYELPIPDATGGDSITLVVPTTDDSPVAAHLKQRGPGIFQWTIDVRDLRADLARLDEQGVGYEVAQSASSPGLAWIDPGAFKGVRVELRQPNA